MEELGWEKMVDSRKRVRIVLTLWPAESRPEKGSGGARREEKEGRPQALEVPVRTKAAPQFWLLGEERG